MPLFPSFICYWNWSKKLTPHVKHKNEIFCCQINAAQEQAWLFWEAEIMTLIYHHLLSSLWDLKAATTPTTTPCNSSIHGVSQSFLAYWWKWTNQWVKRSWKVQEKWLNLIFSSFWVAISSSTIHITDLTHLD